MLAPANSFSHRKSHHTEGNKDYKFQQSLVLKPYLQTFDINLCIIKHNRLLEAMPPRAGLSIAKYLENRSNRKGFGAP